MKIGELLVQLGVTADTFTVRDFTKAIGDLPFSVAGAITSLTGLSIGFLELTKHTLDTANNLGVFRAETGLSIEELQRWTGVAKQVGISTDSVQQSFVRLTQVVAQGRLGHMDMGFMLALGQMFSGSGISPRISDAMGLMADISARAKQLPPSIASAMLANMGLSPEMMRIFELGPGQFNRMAGRGQVMNAQELAVFQDFQEHLAAFALTIEKSFVPALEKAEPYLKDLADALGVIVTTVFGTAVYAAGESARLFNEIRKQGGVGNFMDNLVNSMLTPDQIKAGMAVAPGGTHVTQHIHSTADPQEVARIAHEHLKREQKNASKQFNNGGY